MYKSKVGLEGTIYVDFPVPDLLCYVCTSSTMMNYRYMILCAEETKSLDLTENDLIKKLNRPEE